jgi:3-oxoacyl-[acyl-carrier-protein] synthase II
MNEKTREEKRRPAGEPRRVVITGIGPVTASGTGLDALWDGLRGTVSPIRTIDRFDPSPFPSRVAAQVDDFRAEDFMDSTDARRLDRFGHFTLAATRLALQDAGLDPGDVDPARGTVQMGSALGGIALAEEQVHSFRDRGLKGVNPRLALSVFCGAASSRTAIFSGFTGPNSTNAMSCASGAIALGEAWRLIREGEADVALAGGVEAPLAPLSFGAFAVIKAMSTRNHEPGRACRPFDAGRDGFVMGEAACVLVMEEESHARRRGARIRAELAGYGTSSDAHHMVAPRPDGSSAAGAMRRAMETAGLAPDDIDHVNAHASSTPLNDSTESRVIRQVLGARADEISVTGTKAFYGHALGASGALEAAIVALTLARGWVPPTLNLEEPGEDCDLPYVRVGASDMEGGRSGIPPASRRSGEHPGEERDLARAPLGTPGKRPEPNQGAGAGTGGDREGTVGETSGEEEGPRLRHALTNSFGFGGVNACLALSRVEG